MNKTKTLVAALMALVLSGCETLQSIDKGLYKVADAVSETDTVTGQRALSFADRRQQIQQGNQYIQQLVNQEQAQGRKINAALSPEMYARLTRVFEKIHQVSHLRDEQWQALLIERDSFNAFTTGGTFIVVHTGLMEQLSNDDELAAVIGHEVAHTVANHVFERQSHSQLAALSRSNSAKTGVYQAAFTHENEREADRIGILYAALAGYDPAAASRIWLRQYQSQGNSRALFAHSHPVNSERYAQTQAVAGQVDQYYKPGRIHPNHVALLENNVLWQKREQEAAAGEGGGLQALLTTALGTYVQHEKSKAEAARQVAHAQFVQAVEAQLSIEKQQLSQQGLSLWVKYNQGPALKDLTLGLMVKQGEAVKQSVSPVVATLDPGQVVKVTLPLPQGVSAQQLKELGARLYVDDALPR